MKKARLLAALLLCMTLLCGCGNLLERQYSVVQPHSQKYWEAGSSGVLRAEDYPEIVNGILTLVAAHNEQGVIRVYMPEKSVVEAEALLEQACLEVQTETPVGAFMVDYLSYTVTEETAFWEAELSIGYRRTAEQYAAVVNVTSSAAVPDMVRTAVEEGREELALRISYLTDTEETLLVRMQELEQQYTGESGLWTVSFYPDLGENRIIEIIFKKFE